ncbi:hypothetical protein NC653_022629 [Populus alba x Populus x berolinensis]|uniref:Uncharacterized protein n=1 Tax=Populus alba x Populus x berolinensis TaxID=444605 RepID=A0AAD6MFV9_9ROSI|nr:hypothetical protein NC653_022629 [Populus alba x Populus x berolinensis]
MAYNSPRDAVLKLIKENHPAVFLHGVRNGSYNAPSLSQGSRRIVPLL